MVSMYNNTSRFLRRLQALTLSSSIIPKLSPVSALMDASNPYSLRKSTFSSLAQSSRRWNRIFTLFWKSKIPLDFPSFFFTCWILMDVAAVDEEAMIEITIEGDLKAVAVAAEKIKSMHLEDSCKCHHYWFDMYRRDLDWFGYIIRTRILRHMASELSLNMRGDGFVKVDDLLKLNLKTTANIQLKSHTIDEIREVSFTILHLFFCQRAFSIEDFWDEFAMVSLTCRLWEETINNVLAS